MALNVNVNNKNCAFRVRGKIKQMIFSSKCSFKFCNYSASFTFIAKFCFIRRSLLEKRLYVPPLFGASGERVSTIKLFGKNVHLSFFRV